MTKQYLSVTALNRYLKAKFDQDANLSRVYIRAELSNVKYHHNGHCYFTLIDEHARVNGVMFASYLKKLDFRLEDGIQVLVTGSVTVYEAGGQYQIYAYAISRDGLGHLYELFLATKERLQKAGLFDENHKKTLPAYPRQVGVITASTGAAIHDLIKTLHQRAPYVKITLFPSLVQGATASQNLISQLRRADEAGMDVLIIGRGGGSIEELWAFNDESLAQAIYEAKTPIISAVGHESDFTICDFVADHRAATPTAGAVAAVPDLQVLLDQLERLEKNMSNELKQRLNQAKSQLDRLADSYPLRNPNYLFESRLLHLENLTDHLADALHLLYQRRQQKLLRLEASYQARGQLFCSTQRQWLTFTASQMQNHLSHQLARKTQQFQSLVSQLDALSPLKVLGRGYTITKQNQHVMTSLEQVDEHAAIEIQFRDGLLTAQPLVKKKGM